MRPVVKFVFSSFWICLWRFSYFKKNFNGYYLDSPPPLTAKVRLEIRKSIVDRPQIDLYYDGIIVYMRDKCNRIFMVRQSCTCFYGATKLHLLLWCDKAALAFMVR